MCVFRKWQFVFGLAIMIRPIIRIREYYETQCVAPIWGGESLCGETAIIYYWIYVFLILLGFILFLTSFKKKEKNGNNKTINVKNFIFALLIAVMVGACAKQSTSDKHPVFQETFIYGDYVYLNVLSKPNDEYFRALKKKFKASWDPVPAIKRDFNGARIKHGNFSTVIGVGINDKGQLIEAVILKSENHSNYDNEALKTVKGIGFFPIPPEELLDKERMLRMAWTFIVYM